MNSKAQQYFEKNQKWKDEYNALRDIICENKLLKEDYKWMHPCYTFENRNIVLIHGFKDYCAILFHKGALIEDSYNVLIQQTENVQSARQIRFADVNQIKKLKTVIRKYIKLAIEIELSGKTIELKKVSDYPMPEEFQRVLKEDKKLNKAFYSLTPGRQKGYLFYLNQAKQSKTRQARIEKYYQKILNGKGLDD